MTGKDKNARMFTHVRKRDGKVVPFDRERIAVAVWKAMQAVGEGSEKDAHKVADKVIADLLKEYRPKQILGIEQIQNFVEKILILEEYWKTAKAYILYRKDRAELREKNRIVPERVKQLVAESRKYFRGPEGEFIYFRSYSRWIEEESRRETWIESVDRYMAFMRKNLGDMLTEEEYAEIREAILTQGTMPSMRLMWSAGNAAEATNVAAYNCAFIAISKLRDFGEAMYLSMCGTGVGFSVEYQNIEQLPQIKKQTGKMRPTYLVPDSKEGWADAIILGLETWYAGEDIKFDYSKIRKAGARLRTMGGRSSGPGPLMALMEFARQRILKRQGRRLKPIDVHDIMCKIGEIVEMGGVRRSAMLSLSDLDDLEMRAAKTGQFYLTDEQRKMANNSVAYNQKPDMIEFMEEWLALAKARTGERGIFNRGGLEKQLPARRWKVFAKDADTCGMNPCGEIVLKSREFCNLTEAVARAEDTEEALLKKVRIAAILGTYQSSLTYFPYLSEEWQKNCEQERLLGVSITGQWDCPLLTNPETVRKLKKCAIDTNRVYAKRIGINPSMAVTCVKPSGTVSQLVDSASGLHTRYSPYYIRRYRISATDSLFKMLKDQKINYYPEVGQTEDTAATYVLEFPVKSPERSVTLKDVTAIQQLERWKLVKENFTEHNPSVSVYIGKDEWLEVAHWLDKNWDIVGGLSFFPREEHVYNLAPYEEITKEQYEEMAKNFPEIDFSQILLYEKDDETKGARELACSAGVCELR